MFKKGLISSMPIVIGYFPVAVTFGINTVALGFSPLEAILSSMLIFAGASQFVLISTMGYSFTNAIIIPLLLNLRHIVYGCVISQKFRIEKPVMTAFGLTDEVFATSLNLASDERYMWGIQLGAYLSWVVGTVIGALGGSILVSNKMLAPSLVFSLKALFFILLMANLEHSSILSAFVGGSIAILLHKFGYTSLGIIVAGILSPIIVMKIKGGEKTE